MYQFQFRIPPYYTLLVRSLSVLEVSVWGGEVPLRLHARPSCGAACPRATWPASFPRLLTCASCAACLPFPPLQGIALASDRQYKVLGAAYPWIARRLLTDTTPELRSTLMALLYKDGRFNFSRMESLVSQAVRPTGRPQPRRSNGPSEQGCGSCRGGMEGRSGLPRPACVGAEEGDGG